MLGVATTARSAAADVVRVARTRPAVARLSGPRARRVLSAVAVVLVALAGAWAGLSLGGRATTQLGPLEAEVALVPRLAGDAVVTIPPLGTLRVDSHDGPLGLRVDVHGVDPVAARAVFTDPRALSTLDDRLAADLRSGVWQAAVRGLVSAIVGAGVAAFLVLRSGRRALLAVGVATTAIAVSAAGAALTYRPEAIREPQFTGLLVSAQSLVGDAQQIIGNFDVYGRQLAAIVTNVSKLYDTTLTLPAYTPADDTIRLLHVSDLHLNPAAWPVIDAVAQQFAVSAVVDSGDIADHGTAAENRYVDAIAGLDVPYVYVRGNHDSVLTEAAVAAQPNAVVLDGEVREVAGLRFIGAADPRFTPDKSTGDTDEERLRTATRRLATRASALDVPADVVVFHDATTAEDLDGSAPLLLSGHSHRRREELLPDGTRLMVQGSTGGAGLRALEGEEPTPVMLSVLYLDAESRQLLAWDDITLGGLGLASATIDRRVAVRPDGTPVGEATPPAGPAPDTAADPGPDDLAAE